MRTESVTDNTRDQQGENELPKAGLSKALNVIETTDETFDIDVFGRSTLVLVDFWAEWCAPCRMLMPILEKLATEYADWLTLVKVNTEVCPETARQFQVQGVPSVFAIIDSEIIDSFQGAMPEPAIREWILALRAKVRINELRQGLAENSEEAVQGLRDLIQEDARDAEPTILLAQYFCDQHEDEEARKLIETLEQRGYLEPVADKIKAQLEMRRRASTVSVQSAQEAATAAPADLGLQFELAAALAAAEQYVECFEICLRLVAEDRRGTGEQARALMVEVFKILPEDSELTSEYRRKLSMALY